ncbi:MAG: DUF3341 domain-containing protein [Labilithrix sp.]|nr:DUF3341 domain-containing protein [Labilithrix sp.]MBX3223239.1 DUF3341 domain-containing protein [Labilithrix sp.]
MRDVIIAELDSPERAVQAARSVRALGYRRVEAFTPFPIPELEDVLGVRRTRLPYLVFFAGLSGAALALLVQWWTNAVDYPIDVGGRPKSSLPTDMLIVFETTVLLAALTAFAAVLVGSRLPRLHDPLFDLPGFERTSLDRFWILIGDAYDDDADVLDEALDLLDGELARLGAVVTRARLPEGRA